MNPPQDSFYSHEEPGTIPIKEFNAALKDLDFQTAEWFRERFGDTFQMCVESPASQRFMTTMLNHLVAQLKAGGDCTVPLVLLAGTMLQTGYMLGRRHAEAEVLDGWMRL